MKKYFEILRKCSLFNNINDDNLISLLGCLDAKVVSYKKRETILPEGGPAKYFGIVLSGNAQIVRIDYFGNRSIVTIVEPSELFGESFACAGVKKLPVDVISGDNTQIMLIDCLRITQSCNNACEFHRQIIYNLMKVVATKNLIFTQKMEITSKRTTREKLMTYLMIQAKKNDSNNFDIPYDRQELADYLEVERSGLSSEISKLRNEGIIECKKNHFAILRR